MTIRDPAQRRLDPSLGHSRCFSPAFVSGWSSPTRKRSVSGPAQAAARVASNGCQFQGRSSAIRRAGWSAMRASRSAR